MSQSLRVADLIGDLSALSYDPAKAQSVAAAAVEKIYSGDIALVDANNPFVLALEISAVNTAHFLQQAKLLTHKQYPAAAINSSDLYLHLSDTDYINLFALPSRAKFKIWFEKQQILDNLVEDVVTGVSKMTIPRNTVFYASGTPFSLSYPINIRKLNHGELQIVYDAEKTSPLVDLTTNVIDYTESITNNGVTYICFEVDTLQFNINTTYASVSASSGYSNNINIANQFYYCRVWRKVNSAWEEIAVTYTQQVYDINTPTVVAKLTDNILNVFVPLVYILNGSISGKLRIDVYETLGPINQYFGNLQLPDFSATWLAIDENEKTPEVAAVSKINNLLIFSTDITNGGRNALSFEEVRQRVIDNTTGPRKIPITPAQAKAMLNDSGYVVVVGVDSITNRRFIASKSLPLPAEILPKIDNNVFTAANAHILSSVIRVSDAVNLYGCVPNEIGMAITSKALFNNTNGVLSLLSNSAYQLLTTNEPDTFVSLVNDGDYYYTPFYYILDTASQTFNVRAYSLDFPKIDQRTFIQENPTTGLQVSIGSTFYLVKTDTGYRLTISTKSNDAYKALSDSLVMCQLRLLCSDNSYAYINAAQVTRANASDERVFIFNIDTTYAIDIAHTLDIMAVREDAASARLAALNQTCSVLFTTSSAMPGSFVTSEIDSIIGDFTLPNGSVGLTHEKLKLHLGDYLESLWLDYRSSADSIEYQTWTTDELARYETDVYRQDPITGSFFTVVDSELIYDKLHSAGDVKLDLDGNEIYAHRQGDIKLDADGKPIPIDNYQGRIIRIVDFYVIDASYRFANDAITTTYMQGVIGKLLDQILQDIPTLNEIVLEQTSILYHPIISDGNVEAYIDEDNLIILKAPQDFTVKVYVPNETALNPSLLASLETLTIKTIGEYLADNTTVSVDAMESILRTKFGADAISVQITGLGAAANYRVLTLKNQAARLSLNKKLVVKINNLIGMEEAVSVKFITHNVQ